MSAYPELRELITRYISEEPSEIRQMRTGTLPDLPGSYGQYFTAWDFANSIVRDYSMNLYQLVRMATDESLSVENLLTVFRTLDPIYSTFLGYNGFPMLAEYAAKVGKPADDRRELVDRLSTLTEYVNRLTAWSHHYFPWHVGEHYRYATSDVTMRPEYTPAPVDTEDDPLRRIPIKLTWQPLGVEVTAELAYDLNEQLCVDFVKSLPFTVLQDHAVVSGESMYAWAPLVSVAPTPVRERICDAPIGRLRFSQATGNKLIVQYGPTSETLSNAVLGKVIDDHIDRLPEVGKAVWESTFRTKEHIWLTAELL
ncbi:cucumopine synthase-related protein [Nonomuraea helvata]|uniref:Cucumopine synthase C-terminal helical bundle domain-containing protein n=1 Tax=Nonomuraea helvata TaxID=37484 RepID=A0ABV5SDB9_9ACTN